MKKNIIIAILVLVIIVLLIFKGFMIKETKEDMLAIAKDSFSDIDTDYERIRENIKKEDGSNLSNYEIENLLLNTGLYRTLFTDDETFIYITNVNFFNTKSGSITFNFKAINGDTISNTFKYIRNGETEYLIADNFEESNKEKERYYFDVDLANGDTINYNEIETKERIDYEIIHFGYEDERTYIEILKEAKDDIKASNKKSLTKEIKSLKRINENYDIKWNDDYTIFSVYYDESIEEKVIAQTLKVRILYSSITSQALNNNPDWHLTINYYDYQTNELLKTETFR